MLPFRKRRPCVLALLVVVSLGMGFLASGCSTAPDPWPRGKSPKVLASFPPLYCFAANLIGPEAAVLSLLTTTGPHDYHVTPDAAITVKGADLFLVNGLGLDDQFTGRLRNSSGNLNLHYVELGKAVPPESRRKLTEAERQHDHHGHSHAHGTHDPHVWLGIPEAILMVERLRDELKRVDPAHAADYDRRAVDYVARLRTLHETGKKDLVSLKPEQRRLVTMHDSLYYFARAFDLKIVGSLQSHAGVELDAVDMKKLIDLCKTENVAAITVEPQYPKNSAETLRKELGANTPKLVVLDTLETAEPGELNADWYELKMRQNLKNLADGLR